MSLHYQRRPDTSRTAPGLRILVVEDDSDTAYMMRSLLQASGFDARSVGSYKEALKYASEWIPDFLVSDIGLPGKDGLELVKTMCRAYPSLRGIVVSGYADPADVERSHEAGFSKHLIKPIDAEELIATIHQLFHAMDH